MKIVRYILTGVFILSLGMFGLSVVVKLTEVDTTRPEIISDRDILEIPCEYTEEQLLEGLSASDGKDGDLTSQIIPGSFSRFIQEGVCNLTYVVFDSSNQPAALTRKVRFTDYHAPRFTLTEPLVFAESEGGYNEAMERVGAQDMLDGDLKESVARTASDATYNKAGSYTLTVQVANSLGDTSTAELPVHVVKAERRMVDIELTEGIVYLAVGDEIEPRDYIESVTGSDGENIGRGSVDVSSGADTSAPGIYEVHYTAADDSGNAGETWMTVIVEEKGETE